MTKLQAILTCALISWSACGGGWIVNQVHGSRGVVVVEKVRTEPNPFAAEVAKYTPLMEKLMGNRRVASPPENIRRSPDEVQVVVTSARIPILPRARPVRDHSPAQDRSLEDVITLAEAGL